MRLAAVVPGASVLATNSRPGPAAGGHRTAGGFQIVNLDAGR